MDLYNRPLDNPDTKIPLMDMDELSPKLCGKSHGNPYFCIDCTNQCVYGKRAVELLEEETKTAKKLTKKQQYSQKQRVEAMSNYVEAMQAEDPVRFVMTTYKIENVRSAKNKIYQWQHNYGTNIRMVSDKIKLLESEIAASQAETDKDSPKVEKAEIEKISPTIQGEEKKMTKRQEEKVSQSHLEKMRADLEKEFIKKESEIVEAKKIITDCEKRMEEITNEITAIRQVLEIFKKKDALYV